MWDSISERLQPLLREPGQIPLLVGCDCSVVVGTAQALMKATSAELHVLYVDGDFDEGAQLIGVLARDPRIRVIEVSEYASLRDNDLRWMGQLIDVLTQALHV